MKLYNIIDQTIEDFIAVMPCECGFYPEFIQPDFHYTDIWLTCPNCGKETWNTGGYDYASEIPLKEAKRKAIIAWNKRELRKK